MDSTSTVSRASSPYLGTSVAWWLYLITGALWFVVAWIVLRFDLTSVAAVSVLAGTVILLAGVAELFNAILFDEPRLLNDRYRHLDFPLGRSRPQGELAREGKRLADPDHVHRHRIRSGRCRGAVPGRHRGLAAEWLVLHPGHDHWVGSRPCGTDSSARRIHTQARGADRRAHA